MTSTLYDINRNLATLLDLAEMADRGISADEVATLDPTYLVLAEQVLTMQDGAVVLNEDAWRSLVDACMADADAKIEAIAHVITDTKATADRIKAERQRLAERAKVCERTIARLESMIEQTIGHSKWQSKVSPLKLSYRRTERVDIYDESQLPESVLVTKTEITPSKTAIKALIKAGEVVPGAQIGESWSLLIK